MERLPPEDIKSTIVVNEPCPQDQALRLESDIAGIYFVLKDRDHAVDPGVGDLVLEAEQLSSLYGHKALSKSLERFRTRGIESGSDEEYKRCMDAIERYAFEEDA